MKILEEVTTLLRDQLNVPKRKITLETNLKDDLGADSLDLLEIAMGIENEYGIEINEDVDLVTVGSLVKVITEETKGE